MNKQLFICGLLLGMSSLQAELLRPLAQNPNPVRPSTRPTLINNVTLQGRPATKEQGFVSPELTECLSKGYNVYECQQQINDSDVTPQEGDVIIQLDEATKYY